MIKNAQEIPEQTSKRNYGKNKHLVEEFLSSSLTACEVVGDERNPGIIYSGLRLYISRKNYPIIVFLREGKIYMRKVVKNEDFKSTS